MIRANLAVALVTAAILALVVGLVAYTLGPGGGQGGEAPPGAGPSGVGGALVGPAEPAIELPPAATEQPAQQPAGRAQATGQAPAGPLVSGGGGRAGSVPAAPAVVGPVAACNPTLLQTMLGLVTAMLGGQGAC